MVGRAIKRYSRREDIVLATKVHGKMHDGPGGRGLSRKAILEQVDASLARLGTEYIDLYQIHRFDLDTPVEETMEALHDVVKTPASVELGKNDGSPNIARTTVGQPAGAAHCGRPCSGDG